MNMRNCLWLIGLALVSNAHAASFTIPEMHFRGVTVNGTPVKVVRVKTLCQRRPTVLERLTNPEIASGAYPYGVCDGFEQKPENEALFSNDYTVTEDGTFTLPSYSFRLANTFRNRNANICIVIMPVLEETVYEDSNEMEWLAGYWKFSNVLAYCSKKRGWTPTLVRSLKKATFADFIELEGTNLEFNATYVKF